MLLFISEQRRVETLRALSDSVLDFARQASSAERYTFAVRLALLADRISNRNRQHTRSILAKALFEAGETVVASDIPSRGSADGYFTADGNVFVRNSDDESALLWNAGTGKFRQWSKPTPPNTPTPRILTHGHLRLSSDGKTVTDTKTGVVIQLPGGDHGIFGASFSPNGYTLLTWSDSHIIIISTRTWKQLRTMTDKVDKDSIGSPHNIDGFYGTPYVLFSRDGNYVYVALGLNVPAAWDTRSGHVVKRFLGHSDYVSGMDLSADGQRLLTASQDGTARLWDTKTGREVEHFVGHDGGVRSVARRFGSGGEQTGTLSAQPHHTIFGLL